MWIMKKCLLSLPPPPTSVSSQRPSVLVFFGIFPEIICLQTSTHLSDFFSLLPNKWYHTIYTLFCVLHLVLHLKAYSVSQSGLFLLRATDDLTKWTYIIYLSPLIYRLSPFFLLQCYNVYIVHNHLSILVRESVHWQDKFLLSIIIGAKDIRTCNFEGIPSDFQRFY